MTFIMTNLIPYSLRYYLGEVDIEEEDEEEDEEEGEEGSPDEESESAGKQNQKGRKKWAVTCIYDLIVYRL